MEHLTTKLTHPFKDILPDVNEFLHADNDIGVIDTISLFCSRIDTLSNRYKDSIKENDFKGWSLELLVEFFIKTNEADNRVGIWNYTPISDTDSVDVGVDGYGIGENQKPATVQVKFRAGNYVLKANDDHLSNFLASSWSDHDVDIKDDKNMLIITTGLKVDEWTRENMLKNKVRVLNREALQEMLDNRPMWWTNFYDAIQNSRIKPIKASPPIVLRLHQKEAVTANLETTSAKGKIILPTGTGKTPIEAELIRQKILEVQKRKDLPVIKINSPRILLCFQLFEQVFKYLNSYGISASYINYNSGQANSKFFIEEIRKTDGVYQQIVSTTSSEEVKEAYKKSVKSQLPLIIFSTYHSSEKFSNSELVPDLTIHDEAHNLVSPEFSDVAILPSKADRFFTATEKVTESDMDLGMNNTDRFGEMIYSKSPKEMIDAGEMVPPYVHVVIAKRGSKVNDFNMDSDYDAILKSIISAHSAHQKKIDLISFDKSQLGAKVLVVCRGQEDLQEMFKTKIFDNFRNENPKIHIFALSSDFGIYNDDEGKINPPVTNAKKYSMLKKLQNLKSGEQAIIFHVDMVGEGIDVPGITGVMPFRNCDIIKFFQNVGRTSRLHPIDREKLYKDPPSITPKDRSKWIKPYSWIIIPDFLWSTGGFEDRFRGYIERLRNEYGFIPRQQIVIDNPKGLDESDDIDKVNENIKNKRGSKSGVEDFDHEFEELTIESVMDKIIRNYEIQKEYEKACKALDDVIYL